MMEKNWHPLKVFSGNAHPALAREICEHLDVPLGQASIGRFPDGEVRLQILENVRGADVFVVQPTCQPVNDNLMELLILLDAFRRASAQRITAVIPYYGYARQDRKDRPRVPISSKLVADLLTTAGSDRVLALDLHAGQIQGYFNIPVDHLYATPVTVEHFHRLRLKSLAVVSPDPGGVERARSFAKRMKAPLAIIDKRREDAHVVEMFNVIGDVVDKTCLIVDDMIDTGGTLVQAAQALLDKGESSPLVMQVDLDGARHQAHSQARDDEQPHSVADEVSHALAGFGGEGAAPGHEIAVGLAEEHDRGKVGQGRQHARHDPIP